MVDLVVANGGYSGMLPAAGWHTFMAPIRRSALSLGTPFCSVEVKRWNSEAINKAMETLWDKEYPGRRSGGTMSYALFLAKTPPK